LPFKTIFRGKIVRVGPQTYGMAIGPDTAGSPAITGKRFTHAFQGTAVKLLAVKMDQAKDRIHFMNSRDSSLLKVSGENYPCELDRKKGSCREPSMILQLKMRVNVICRQAVGSI
jgi:hypothetical protein